MTNVQAYPPTAAQAHPAASKHRRTDFTSHAPMAHTPRTLHTQPGDRFSMTPKQ